MKKFDISNYPGKYVTHCKTEEEAKTFCNYLRGMGKTWNNGGSYDGKTEYSSYKERTVYYFNDGMYGHKEGAEDTRHTILEFSDFDSSSWFTKSDLKTGMVVEDKKEERFFVLGEILIDDCRRRDFDDYYDNLLNKEDADLDIVKVYSVNFGEVCVLEDLIYDDDCLELIWERKEDHKEMTVEEIEKALGYKVKIIGENE